MYIVVVVLLQLFPMLPWLLINELPTQYTLRPLPRLLPANKSDENKHQHCDIITTAFSTTFA